MTTLSPPPARENEMPSAEPASRWRRLIPRSRRGKTAVAGGLAVLLVAGVLGATYETSPGGALWGAEKAVFPEHAQDVALTAVVNDLKKAQDILGGGQQPTPDQLTDARTSLNQAKQDLDYLSPSPQRTSLQNLYLQLTQQLLQYTPDSVQQLPALPAPPPPAADPGNPPQTPDAALTSATAPTWGYPITDEAGSDFVSPPPDVPDAPADGWPQPYGPPLTPNLDDLGYYDPSWGQLYGYDPTDWYNYDLSGYNQYGFDFLGFDRWGYDRWGYDRWGCDRWGYNWSGYTWAGYDRNGWDRDGRNEWGQRRDHPGDPRNQDWYNSHHPYEQYYQWKFQNDDPVYHRTQWDQAHGFNPNVYQNWNMNRDWHDPRNRDWAPLATASTTAKSVTDVDIHASSPVVNLNASLTQFISNDTATSNSGSLMKDLADKSTRDFTKELAPRTTVSIGWPPPSTFATRPATPTADHQRSFAPPALTASVPTTPPSKVSPGFIAPKLSPVPVYTPPTVAQPRGKPEPTPANIAPRRDPNPSSAPTAIPPKAGSPNPAGAPPAEQIPVTPPNPAVTPPGEDSAPHQANPVPQAPESEPRTRPATPIQQEPPQQPTAPEPPAQHAPAPEVQAPAPEAPIRQAPVHQAPPPQAPARQQPVRQAPPVREAPPPAARPAPEPRPAPAPRAPKCSLPMC
jgi:hypothetical protein